MSNNPILVVGTTCGFGTYTGEILKAEGFNAFDVKSPFDAGLSLEFLRKYDIVILGEIVLNPEHKSIIYSYISEGGNLIAFRPDKRLAPVFGLVVREGTLKNGYIKINTGTEIGESLITETMQFHGEADIYHLNRGSEIAALYTDSAKKSGCPAVVVNKYGGGLTVAFTYNLPKSIVLTRQGNLELAGLETDGITGIRGMDLFAGGWLDTSKNHLNQADEQMRLLTRCIDKLCESRKPLPRFWYFPNMLKSLVILTNDGEDNTEVEFDSQFKDIESKGALMTLYIKELDLVSSEKVKMWVDKGHEISGHPDDTEEAASPTWNRMDSVTGSMVKYIREAYGQEMKTVANHWFVWVGDGPDGRQDFTAQAKIEAKHGMKMDLNYAHYDNGSTDDHSLGLAGNFTGSGLPMRFADADGNIIDIYQVHTNVYDQEYMEKDDPEGFFSCFKIILDRSLENEIFSFVGLKAHRAEWHWSRTSILKMLDYAKLKGVPVWTARKALDFILMKDAAVFKNINWSHNQLSFTVYSPVAGEGLTFMVPCRFDGKTVNAITKDGIGVPYTVRSLKGKDYAYVMVSGGSNYIITVYYG